MARCTAAVDALSWQIQPSWLGRVLVAWSPQGVRAILLADDDEAALAELRCCFSSVPTCAWQGSTHPWVKAVLDLIAHPNADQAHTVSLPLHLAGTPFQQSVWAALQQISPGRTVSYGELAQRLGHPRAVRAVAGACAANVLAVAIPCHRVVRRDGKSSGYRWGLWRKQALLQRETAVWS
ncbi:MAG: methylated-DNA--[protein]-cysteine S-methyltransferase [Aquabacterium sp.]|jgi:AraC family transcriptional regulator of adaptative response/methylated-DNA-[protein]-cysteine methyltransferase|uniref:methylated-DNA--[protein]-cysteine S-methyltransferase n=1 Tax=Aquabacterium sp. TaxID=1872578 RepID=UPI001B78EC2F|nr:methylated-DNA--[protein]-cysteine S-methyltransferase [Aquabacterium sp.]MBP7132418.1 methylated-DNA--[protein]-cysteine S-methyltransferase [Aquabacterium sp.]MBP9063695.1 methylated-DNA--[protein]-cysteine S-methyltransferase [Aquabacterium sp.]MDQ5927471.1 AraC family transcriptional regulator [Pseudomonadota bacterium]